MENMRKLAQNIGIRKELLVRANEESIRLGFNRNLNGLERLPDQIYVITQAFEHVGFNGSDHDCQNVRLFLMLSEKAFDDPMLSDDDMISVFLDVTTDTWAEILGEERRRSERIQRQSGVQLSHNDNVPWRLK